MSSRKPAVHLQVAIRKARRGLPKDKKLVQHEHHTNSAEEGDTANIKQNATNEGYFRGRRES
jgi:hypothetical protein